MNYGGRWLNWTQLEAQSDVMHLIDFAIAENKTIRWHEQTMRVFRTLVKIHQANVACLMRTSAMIEFRINPHMDAANSVLLLHAELIRNLDRL